MVIVALHFVLGLTGSALIQRSFSKKQKVVAPVLSTTGLIFENRPRWFSYLILVSESFNLIQLIGPKFNLIYTI